jgi:two-component system NtrC family response regulator
MLRRYASEMRRPVQGLSDDAVRAIEAHNWPGNVRELQNLVKRASIMADGDRITAGDLGLAVPPSAEGDEESLDLRTVRERAERAAVISALSRTDGNMVKASELLGVSRPTLYDLINRLQIK